MGTVWDAPNQQVVRADGSGPGIDDGTGTLAVEQESSGDDLDQMTKSELLDYAAAHGVAADQSMTKAEITDAIAAQESAAG